ncbi:FecR domain-containing protein [Marinifilum fragile]|uniref:FecR family protein n=1 Tax=Marinifilum fragile TaxID=570161 RepID=UPI002AA90CF9|nr:FecR domain-containing protein [Marinifilum fragile]
MSNKDKIAQFLQGQLSEEEQIQFLDWVYSNAENKKEYFQQKDIWDSYKMHSEKGKINLKREWRILSNRIDLLKIPKTYTIKKSFALWMRVAAIVIVVFGLGWGANMFLNSMNKPEKLVHKLEVPKGQRSKLALADGTEVWLNSDSKLDFSFDDDKKQRVVTLSGEAFFNVSKDKEKPFIVNVKGQSLKVLGTVFNVRAYENEENVYTTLEEGSVEVKAAGRAVIIEPNQQLIYSRLSNRLSLKKVDTNYYTVWREGRYVFENESFDNLIRMVERWYDVQFEYPKEFFKNMHYSGVIKRTKPVEHVLSLINHITKIKYEYKGDVIVIIPVE